jgi:hypothetical protein
LASAFALALFASGSAWAQHSAGKDTSELEKPNPQQSQCSQISNVQERQRCMRENAGSGGPGGKPPEARRSPPTGPGVGREMRPVPNDQPKTTTDPDRPASSR